MAIGEEEGGRKKGSLYLREKEREERMTLHFVAEGKLGENTNTGGGKKKGGKKEFILPQASKKKKRGGDRARDGNRGGKRASAKGKGEQFLVALSSSDGEKKEKGNVASPAN